nr:MAG TPA: hypothetical protein [Caudoviricetes sp.]DAM52003.1 MAG TPA: hypothetical protein [Bacteriophage sp.]
MAAATQLEPAPDNKTARRRILTNKERREGRYLRRKAARERKAMDRSRACGNFEDVFSFMHLWKSAKKCCRGVKWKSSTQSLMNNMLVRVADIHTELMDGTFRHKGFHEFTVYERGKARHIRAVHITERVVQKCLCDYALVPVYQATFIYDNSASLKGRGMDRALRRYKKHVSRQARRGGYVLRYDFRKFFDTAPHKPLFEANRRLFHDPRTAAEVDRFIRDFGDYGLGLGSQVSQVCALMLASPIDHLCKDKLRLKGYGRYNDDGYAMHESRAYLETCLTEIRRKATEIGIVVNEKKTGISPAGKSVFLKCRYHTKPDGGVKMRMGREATARLRKKLPKLRKMVHAGKISLADVQPVWASYCGHMNRGNSHKAVRKSAEYFKSIFGFYPDKEGWSYALAGDH